MVVSKINNLDVSSNDLDFMILPSGEAFLLIPGGNNENECKQVQICREISIGDGYEVIEKFDTIKKDIDIKSHGVICGYIKMNSVIAILVEGNIRLYALGSSEDNEIVIKEDKKELDDDLKLNTTILADFQADFSLNPLINSCVLLPSGHIISGGDDGICRVWSVDVPSSDKRDDSWTIFKDEEWEDHSAPIVDMCNDAVSSFLCTASLDGTCNLYELDTGQNYVMQCNDAMKIIPNNVDFLINDKDKIQCKGCCFSEDGNNLYTIQCYESKNNTYLTKWSFELISSPLEFQINPINTMLVSESIGVKLCISENGRYISVGLVDGSIVILETISFKILFDKKVHESSITGLKFTPIAELAGTNSACIVVSCSHDKTLVTTYIRDYTMILSYLYYLAPLFVLVMSIYGVIWVGSKKGVLGLSFVQRQIQHYV
jgi:WD40 repeat protein